MEKEKIIRLQDRVAITATEKAVYHKPGEVTMVHPVVAEKLKKSGQYK